MRKLSVFLSTSACEHQRKEKIRVNFFDFPGLKGATVEKVETTCFVESKGMLMRQGGLLMCEGTCPRFKILASSLLVSSASCRAFSEFFLTICLHLSGVAQKNVSPPAQTV